MTTIKYDQYSKKYFVAHSESNIVAMTFEQLEEFGELIHQVCQDEYSRALQEDLLGDDDCIGCKI